MFTLLLVDGHAYAYRAFHAIRNLRGPDGRPTNALFGFIKMLGRMRGLVKPTHVAVVWDGGLSAERVQILPEYKAQRPPMPDELAGQIEEIAGYLGVAGVLSLRWDGVEADDLIASLASKAANEGAAVVIASSDKDFFQLVSPVVGLLNPGDKSETIWNKNQVRDKTGVDPEQVVDWLSLIGDAVDNIPGVSGVGPKTAADLLRQFGTVEALYARLPEIKSERLRSALAAAENGVRRNQQMIGLKVDLPGLPPLSELGARSPDREGLIRLYQGWGFGSLAAEMERARGRQAELVLTSD